MEVSTASKQVFAKHHLRKQPVVDLGYTAHNLLLNNGEKTMGDRQPVMRQSAIWKSIEKTVDLFIEDSNRETIRVADLGCLEGGYAAEFARMGFEVLGIEARADNIARCKYVKDHLGYSNLHFVQDDVRNIADYGKFDITLCYGLLYHLNDPASFLKILSNSTSKMLLLNTHFAPERDIRYALGFLNRYLIAPLQKRTRFLEYQQNYRLSPLTENEGYKGRWYREWSNTEKQEKIEKMLWASYNNNRSFWLCKKELTKALHSAGFTHVFEQFDFTGDVTPENYTERYNRTMFVAIKD